jgi:hypothetical protein
MRECFGIIYTISLGKTSGDKPGLIMVDIASRIIFKSICLLATDSFASRRERNKFPGGIFQQGGKFDLHSSYPLVLVGARKSFDHCVWFNNSIVNECREIRPITITIR